MTTRIIPIFPTFAPFNIDYKKDYEAIYCKYEAYSEFSFENLAIWLNLNNDLELSKLHDNLILKFSAPGNPDNLLFGIYGDNVVDNTIEEVLSSNSTEDTRPLKIEVVPEFVIQKIKSSFNKAEDRDNFEYLYDVEKHAKLDSPTYSSIRYRVNRFKRENNCINTRLIDVVVYKKLLKKFISSLGVTENDVDGIELLALNRMFDLSKSLDPKCLIVEIDNNIIGFVIFYLINQKTAILSNIKVNYEFKNIFDFTFWSLSNYLDSINYKTINFEQDLGIEGVRNHKMMLKPSNFLKKYTISLKNIK